MTVDQGELQHNHKLQQFTDSAFKDAHLHVFSVKSTNNTYCATVCIVKSLI